MEKDNETIRLQDLSIGYSGKKSHVKLVAEHISASIHSGELTCLIGSNGVGKSTLLRTLSAFQPKINGEIFINGKEISKYNDKQLSHVIGVVLTGKPHIHNITVTELVGLGRSPYTDFWGNLRAEDKEIVRRSLEMVGIEHLSERMIQTLSDGERQKMMIAKALAQQTPIIFLDEPTAFLDYPSKVEMMQLLHRLTREANKTIFLSTHDIELALQITDVIWFMERGKGVSIGTPHELASDGTLSRYIERDGIKLDTDELTIKVNVV